MPVVNLFFPLSHLNKDRSYDEYKNYLLDAGTIDEPDLNKKVDVKKNDVKEIKQVKINHSNYQPLYREENNTLDEEKGYSYRKILK